MIKDKHKTEPKNRMEWDWDRFRHCPIRYILNLNLKLNTVENLKYNNTMSLKRNISIKYDIAVDIIKLDMELGKGWK